MSEFDKMLHFVAFAIKNKDVQWSPIRGKSGWEYYYAEMRLYLVKGPLGELYLETAKTPADAYNKIQKGKENE